MSALNPVKSKIELINIRLWSALIEEKIELWESGKDWKKWIHGFDVAYVQNGKNKTLI